MRSVADYALFALLGIPSILAGFLWAYVVNGFGLGKEEGVGFIITTNRGRKNERI